MVAYRGKIIPPHILKLMPAADREPLGKAGWTPSEAADKQAVKLEKELQRQICDVLRYRGILFGCQRMDRKSNIAAGYPDIWFSLPPGVPICFEAKVEGRQQRPDQQEAQAVLERNGWRYYVVRSVGQALEILAEFGLGDPK